MKFVLIADDEADILALYEDALKEVKDIKITSASNGAEAYTKTRNQAFDLIISDYRMPKLNGVQFISALRSNKINANTPIYIVTGYAKEVKIELEKEKLDYNLVVVEKPVSLDFIKELALNPNLHILPSKEKIKEKSKTLNVKVSLDVNFVNPYIKALQETFKIYARVEYISFQKPYLLEKQTLENVDISSKFIIESNFFNGFLILGFPLNTFLKTSSEILCKEQKEINAENNGVIAEINNIIFHKCQKYWNELNFEYNIAEPIIEVGRHDLHNLTNEMTTLVIPFQTNYGSLVALICSSHGL